jgi:hypothetical protein
VVGTTHAVTLSVRATGVNIILRRERQCRTYKDGSMNRKAPATIAEAQQVLHDAGWSIGDTATHENGQLIWHVYCHRDEHKVVTKDSVET